MAAMALLLFVGLLGWLGGEATVADVPRQGTRGMAGIMPSRARLASLVPAVALETQGLELYPANDNHFALPALKWPQFP